MLRPRLKACETKPNNIMVIIGARPNQELPGARGDRGRRRNLSSKSINILETFFLQNRIINLKSICLRSSTPTININEVEIWGAIIKTAFKNYIGIYIISFV